MSELKETYRRLFPEDEGGQVNSAYLDQMAQWERNRTPIRRLKWSSDQLEGNPGDDEPFRRTDVGICWGTGSFMDTSWFCLEAGTFNRGPLFSLASGGSVIPNGLSFVRNHLIAPSHPQ